jgi:DNA processing protein
MNDLDARQCLLLHGLTGLGDRLLSRLFLHYGCAAKIWDSRPRDWRSLGVPDEVTREAIAVQANSPGTNILKVVERQLNTLQQLGARVVSLADAEYPVLLRTIYDPPPILYVLGDLDLLQQAQLGIVGSRKASPPGRRAALELSRALALAGLHICSGLARGIDQAAHRGALDAGGKTIAVMATGLDVIYPAGNRGLAQEIIHSGCLLTEFPPGSAPLRARFPQRNRIISGLSLGVLVIEAAMKSGSLITARTAMEQGREVFALPWSMFHPVGGGCLNLIRDGAKMVQTVGDILEELGPLYQCQRELQCPIVDGGHTSGSMGESEAGILHLIGSEAVSVDEIVEHSGLAVATVLATLSTLEVERRIVRCSGGYIHC